MGVHLGKLRLMHCDFSISARTDTWEELIKKILFNSFEIVVIS